MKGGREALLNDDEHGDVLEACEAYVMTRRRMPFGDSVWVSTVKVEPSRRQRCSGLLKMCAIVVDN